MGRFRFQTQEIIFKSERNCSDRGGSVAKIDIVSFYGGIRIKIMVKISILFCNLTPKP